jgi:S-methylmethionine-dependent homocysteine/selenocysteine methylase
LALDARDAAGALGADVAIAGCLPPLNGTYRPDLVRAFGTNFDEYCRLAELQAPHVDLFVCETMSTADEGRAAATATSETGKPVWVSWCLGEGGGKLRSGETIAQATAGLRDLRIGAVLANCSPPESIAAAMPELVATGIVAGGYANGFTDIPVGYRPGRTLEQLRARTDLDPDAYAAFVLGWVNDGARIVGGCCEVGPTHIVRLRELLAEHGHTVVGLLTS